MVARIPNLFISHKEPRRLYELYLSKLFVAHQHERMIASCRTIRRHAARSVGTEHACFTFFFELEALCSLHRYEAAWRQLRTFEQLAFGERFDLNGHQWEPAHAHLLLFNYGPILWFREQFQLGCSLFEAGLRFYFEGRKRPPSYDMMFRIYKPGVPQNTYAVTLRDFYGRLGKDLRDWQYWEGFVQGFHPRLFRIAGVTRDELREDPWLLAVFYRELMRLQDERVTSGVSRGEADLVQSPAKVRRYQEGTHEKLEKFREDIRPTQNRTDRALKELFPELRDTPQSGKGKAPTQGQDRRT